MTDTNAYKQNKPRMVAESAASSRNLAVMPNGDLSQETISERDSCCGQEPAPDQQNRFTVEPQPFGKVRSTVIVVEDHNALRDTLCEYLRGAGYDVFGAARAKEALLLLEANKAKSTMLVTDLVLQGDGGWPLTQWARQWFPDLPIVFISGCIDESTIRPALAHGNAAFLEKPFAFESLDECLKALNGKSER